MLLNLILNLVLIVFELVLVDVELLALLDPGDLVRSFLFIRLLVFFSVFYTKMLFKSQYLQRRKFARSICRCGLCLRT